MALRGFRGVRRCRCGNISRLKRGSIVISKTAPPMASTAHPLHADLSVTQHQFQGPLAGFGGYKQGIKGMNASTDTSRVQLENQLSISCSTSNQTTGTRHTRSTRGSEQPGFNEQHRDLPQRPPPQRQTQYKLMLTNQTPDTALQSSARRSDARAPSVSMHVICSGQTPQASGSWHIQPLRRKSIAMEDVPTPLPNLAPQVCYNCKVRKRKCTKELPSCGLCTKCVIYRENFHFPS
jgi:hypothetical protein